MSVGMVIGAIVSGTTAYLKWGTFAATMIGMGIGTAIGSYIDPITPDTPSPAAPSKDVQVSNAEVGIPIPDVLGTAEVTGNFLWYGREWTKELKERVDTGLFSSEKITTGYLFYMDFAQGLCRGPVDKLFAIYDDYDNEPLWSGEEERPEDGSPTTITLSNERGYFYFYWGTDDQPPEDEFVQEAGGFPAVLTEDMNTPFLGLCWVYARALCIGDSKRPPTYSFVLTKTPSCSFDT